MSHDASLEELIVVTILVAEKTCGDIFIVFRLFLMLVFLLWPQFVMKLDLLLNTRSWLRPHGDTTLILTFQSSKLSNPARGQFPSFGSLRLKT